MTLIKTRFGLCLIFLCSAMLIGCNAPLPEPTPPVDPLPDPTATATVTPRPLATELPPLEPTVTSEPPVSVPATPEPENGFYRNPELGFSFLYPSDWDIENTGADFPAAIIYDNNDPLQLFVGARILDEAVTVEEFAADLGQTFAITGTTILKNDATTLNDGTPAQLVTLSWFPNAISEEDQGMEMQANAIATISNGKGYALMLLARPEVLISREQTFATIAQGLTLEQPQLYGVPRDEGMVLLIEEPANLDPALTLEDAAGIVGHVFSGLVQLDTTMQVVPDLAESWEVTGDGTVYTFKLRSNITFHDNTPLTAPAVVASWERATDPELGSTTAPLYLGDIAGVAEKLSGDATEISGLEVIDDLTLAVTLDGPKPYFLQKLTQPAAFIIDSENVDDGTANTPWWRRPNGSGPFTLRRWQEGSVILLDSYVNYFAVPETPTLIYLPFGRVGVSIFEANIADVAGVSTFNLTRVQDPADPLSASLRSGGRFCTTHILFNLNSGAVADPAVRQALSLALNRTQLADVVAQGGALPAVSYLPPGMPGHQSLSDIVRYDSAEAQTLLGEAAPEFVLSVAGAGDVDRLLTAVIDQWRTELGVEVTIEQRPAADHIAAVQNGEFGDMAWETDCAVYPDPENMLDHPFYSTSPANLSGFSSAAVDDSLLAARTEADVATRIGLYQQAETDLLTEAAVIPVVHANQYTLVRGDIDGYIQSPIPVLWTTTATLTRE